MSEQTIRLQQLVSGKTGRGDEQEILGILTTLPADELNSLLEGEDSAELFESIDNHLLGPDRYDELLQMLTVDRVSELSIHARARIAVVLQRGRTKAREEVALRDVLLSAKGEELTHLKNTINMFKGRHDLEGLVFADIGDEDVRTEILEHFRAEADPAMPREVKVLSDIDDTAIARLHEERYPKDTVVPGVLAFYEALDVGPNDAPRSRGDLTFVTARPSDAMGLVKGKSRRTLSDAGITDLSIMTGSWFKIATHDGMATKKVENVARCAQLFPEYDLVFLGDSGQGDTVAAQKILAAQGDVVRACFIHDVVAMSAEEREELAHEGVWVVDTYIGAALKAHELGLISDAGLRDVVEDTRAALPDITWDSSEQEQSTRALIERDADRAAAVVN